MAPRIDPSEAEMSAAYVSWGTFKNSIIDGFVEGLPHVIDKSLFTGMAGGVQSHLISSLKFLGLIGNDGRPSEAMRKLAVEDETARKEALSTILKSRYSALVAIGLDKASMKQFLDALESEYRVQGETKIKAARFFIAAAQYAGLPLSKYIIDGTPSNGPRRPATKRTPQDGAPAAEREVDRDPTTPPQSVALPGEQRVIRLASGGGTLTLTASVGFMKLAKADREFVFRIIDMFDEYEANSRAGDSTGDSNSEVF